MSGLHTWKQVRIYEWGSRDVIQMGRGLLPPPSNYKKKFICIIILVNDYHFMRICSLAPSPTQIIFWVVHMGPDNSIFYFYLDHYFKKIESPILHPFLIWNTLNHLKENWIRYENFLEKVFNLYENPNTPLLRNAQYA